jgi:O-acetyl-ADP-ribose deacetylase (regulator of RNase III)
VIKYRQGDLFASGLDALAHGCNCQGVMGAGIARGFRDRYPDMYKVYRDACTAGTFRPGHVLAWVDPRTGTVVFNLATQRGTGPAAEPWAVATAIGQMILVARNRGITEIGLPMIGCGIGGLDPVVLGTCLALFEAAPVDLIVYRYAPSPAVRFPGSDERKT